MPKTAWLRVTLVPNMWTLDTFRFQSLKSPRNLVIQKLSVRPYKLSLFVGGAYRDKQTTGRMYQQEKLIVACLWKKDW